MHGDKIFAIFFLIITNSHSFVTVSPLSLRQLPVQYSSEESHFGNGIGYGRVRCVTRANQCWNLKVLSERSHNKKSVGKNSDDDERKRLTALVVVWLATFTVLFEYCEHWGLIQSFFYTIDTGFAMLFGLLVPSSSAGKALTIINELVGAFVAGVVIARYAESILDDARKRHPVGRLVRSKDDESIRDLCDGTYHFESAAHEQSH